MPVGEHASLKRQLGLPSAILLGLGSILGTGVFVSIGLVAGLAGAWTAGAVLVAGLVAACNALSSAQLAAAHPRSGGTYEYGYRLLHPLAGFTAGWTFLCAKSASAATGALGLSGYLLNAFEVDDAVEARWLAGGIVVATTALVATGARRSNAMNTLIVSVTAISLGAFVVGGLPGAVANWKGASAAYSPSFRSLLEATALMFVAYTGYGRIATLGEEVRDPGRTIPRAIVTTLLVSVILYLAVGWVSVGVAGPDVLRAATEGRAAPLAEVARGFGVAGLAELVAVGAIAAMAGVLLNLVLGLSRVLLAMGRRGDMPRIVARVDRSGTSPVVAVVVVGAIILTLTIVGSVRTAWSFSAFTVLVYYALTNLAALRLPAGSRLYPRVWAIGGLGSCVFLAFCVEPRVWLFGIALLIVGAAWHLAARGRAER